MKKNNKFIFFVNLLLFTTFISFCSQSTNTRITANENKEIGLKGFPISEKQGVGSSILPLATK